jgi:hypothetical protein
MCSFFLNTAGTVVTQLGWVVNKEGCACEVGEEIDYGCCCDNYRDGREVWRDKTQVRSWWGKKGRGIPLVDAVAFAFLGRGEAFCLWNKLV